MVAGSTANQGVLPYLVLSVLMVVVVAGRSWWSTGTVQPRRRGRSRPAGFFRGFWVNPRQHPDFGWAFLARFAMVIGFYGAQTYGLYILRDYIGLGEDESNAFAAKIGVVLLLGVLLSALTSGWLSDRIGRRKPFIVWSSVVMSIALAIPLVVPTEAGVLAYSFLLGLGFGAYISIDLALMTEVLPKSLTRGEQRRPRPGDPGPGHHAAAGAEPVDRGRPGEADRWLPGAVRVRHRLRDAGRHRHRADQERAMTAAAER